MMKLKLVLLSLTTIFLIACGEEKATFPGVGVAPDDEIYSGGVPRDGIPALTDPIFIGAGEADYLGDNDLVIGVFYRGEARAYPINILDQHEIVNDDIQGTSICVTYCPLTGSGVVFLRVIDGILYEYGVSGLLFRNNLIPYDRMSNSLYSQMYVKGIRGDFRDIEWQLIPSVQCTWGYWKSQHPDTRILSLDTGYRRDYSESPYGDYASGYQILFPVRFPDHRYHPKHPTLGIWSSDGAMAFPKSGLFEERVVNIVFEETPMVIVYDPGGKLLTAYSPIVGSDTLRFSRVHHVNNSTTLADDQTGSTWNSYGLAISGPMTGEKLERLPYFSAYWFAWHDFYPGTVVYTGG